jgi:hypothetical protein
MEVRLGGVGDGLLLSLVFVMEREKQNQLCFVVLPV